ncbi:MAG TPA: DUF3037 domain-containing protein [Polyangia bacterium]|nr:DUF3037 domain-containing protein [Polyangia bacterium]
MSERHAFDYVIVQVVPRVDRDERMNAGVILFCPASGFLGCRVALDHERLRALSPDVDVDGVARQLAAIQAVAEGDRAAGPIAALSRSERFHWLSAPRSTVVQPSVAHAGLCDAPAAALDRLFRAVVPGAGRSVTAGGRPPSG